MSDLPPFLPPAPTGPPVAGPAPGPTLPPNLPPAPTGPAVAGAAPGAAAPGASLPPYLSPASGTSLPTGVGSPLSDGEWHRLHPLTPVFKGGLFFVVVVGIIIANLRERLVEWFFPTLVPEFGYDGPMAPNPVDYVIDHNLVILVLLAVLGIALVVIALFHLSWRFHMLRITGDDVEVRSGVLFRTHRRAPLDRVQGVNLTRPMFARLCGMAKLEVVGAGTDANVKLEYLSTANAEAVRADILQLASGRRLAAQSRSAAPGLRAAATSAVTAGITGLIVGAEEPVGEPASVVHVPPGRLVASHLLSGSTIALVGLIAAIIVGAIVGTPWLLFGVIPALLAFGTYWVRGITRALRYSIAPTPSGVRITFGLFTTITEILPPGRIHAVEVTQSILWRPAGWWSVSVNRLSGRAAAQGSQDQFAVVLPVGTRADVERVLRLLLPEFPDTEWPLVFDHGILGPAASDPYTNTPPRARLLRLFSWRRNGFLLAPGALFFRRGVVWRKLAVFPLARLQSIGLEQGPLDRALRIASARVHTIPGPVSGRLGAIDRDAALGLFADAEAAAIRAGADDHSHRWGEDRGEAELREAVASVDRTES